MWRSADGWLWWHDRDEHLSFRLPEETLAIGHHRTQACALGVDGTLWRYGPGGAEIVRHIALPSATILAAISGDGTLIVVATDEPDVHIVSPEPQWVSTPDFLWRIDSVCCARDGSAYGYSWLTSQPWSDYGSYGDRERGMNVIAVQGDHSWQQRDHRRHDDDASTHLLAIGRGGWPVVSARHGPRSGISVQWTDSEENTISGEALRAEISEDGRSIFIAFDSGERVSVAQGGEIVEMPAQRGPPNST